MNELDFDIDLPYCYGDLDHIWHEDYLEDGVCKRECQMCGKVEYGFEE